MDDQSCELPVSNASTEEIDGILSTATTIAVVGLSDNPERESHKVASYLQARGYRIVPVNPALAGKAIHGRLVVDSLSAVKKPIDIVDIFRASEYVAPIVDDAIKVGAKAVWMQLGVIDEKAAAKASAAGLKVVMNRCPKIEWRRLGLG